MLHKSSGPDDVLMVAHMEVLAMLLAITIGKITMKTG